jgi:hypothetical protein
MGQATAKATRAEPARHAAAAADSAWSRLRADPGLRLAIVVGVAMRVVLGVGALVSLAIHGTSGTSIEAHREAGTADGALTWPLVGPWEHWDGLWYLHIAGGGYPGGGSEAAFSPLFPGLVRLVAFVTGGDLGLAAWIVVTLAVIAGLWATWHLVDDVLGPAVARRTVLVMALYPAAFFLIAPYPEGLFLALSAGALLAARRQAWGWAGALASLAVLCRPQGAVVVVAMAVQAVAAVWRAQPAAGAPTALLSRGLALARRVGVRPVLAVAAPTAVLGSWFLYCRLALGLELGPLTALRQEWGHHSAWPWQVIADSVQSIATGQKSEEFGNLLAVVVIVALLPFMARRLPVAWTVYTVLALALSLANEPLYSPLMSLMRYVVVLVPVFALIASLRLPSWVWWVLGAAAAAAQGLLVDIFIHRLFVG